MRLIIVFKFVRIVISRMIQIVTDTCRHQNPKILPGHDLPQMTQVYHSVHHLSDAKTMAEVVKRVIPVVFLNTQL